MQVKRYSDEELEEFREIINKKLKIARQSYNDAMQELSKYFELYILSTAPWHNPTAWYDKLEWVQRYFGSEEDSIFYKRVIISHHKNLNRGDFLIDDRKKNGADQFEGELIQFGSAKFPDWPTVVEYLCNHR